MASKPPTPPHAIAVPVLCARRDGSEFHAVTVDLSIAGLRLRAATQLRVTESLICTIRGVGTVAAQVAWADACDFVVRVTGANPSPGEVARRLLDLARLQKGPPQEVRSHRRITPRSKVVPVALADGTCTAGRILNLSVSGVALSLDPRPSVGDEIVVGRRRAKVVRLIAEGIGARFAEPLDDVVLDEAFTLM